MISSRLTRLRLQCGAFVQLVLIRFLASVLFIISLRTGPRQVIQRLANKYRWRNYNNEALRAVSVIRRLSVCPILAPSVCRQKSKTQRSYILLLFYYRNRTRST